MSEIDRSGVLEVVRVSAGEVTYPPGGRLGPRWQSDVQLVLVHTGSARIAIDDGEPSLHRAGSVVLLLPGHRERFDFDERSATHHSWVQVGLAGATPEPIRKAPRSAPASAALTELVREAAEATRTPLSSAEPLLASLAAAAIWRYVGEAESSARGHSEVVDLARAFIHLRLADPGVDLDAVAAAAHVTPAHLVRRFRAELGITPIAYLWRRRVATGVDLLTNTGLPVGEVARRSGFRSVYHFSRRVKQETDLPPTELRNRGWSQTARPGE